MALPPELTSALADYFDEADGADAALRRAATLARSTRGLDIAALLDWVGAYPAVASPRRARATAVLRAALDLPLVPGPPCRTPR